MEQLIIFTDEELESMLYHHGVIHVPIRGGAPLVCMSKKQYERMYPKDPKCPFSDTRRKCSDDCGNVWFCDMCEWWKDYIKRSDDKCEGCTLRELSIETFNDKKGEK